MSETMSQNTGVGWTANALQGGSQHEALYDSRPLYQAAGARRAPAHDPQNTPSDVYIMTRADAQHAIGVVCAGLAKSFFGDLAAQALGTALADWVWQHRTTPPVEREVTAFITGQQSSLAEQVNTQALTGLLDRGGPANLLRRRQQVARFQRRVLHPGARRQYDVLPARSAAPLCLLDRPERAAGRVHRQLAGTWRHSCARPRREHGHSEWPAATARSVPRRRSRWKPACRCW